MTIAAFTAWPVHGLGAIRGALRRRKVRKPRRWGGVREVVGAAIGELWGLQLGVVAGFYLVTGDLMPEPWHHMVWYLALSLGSLAGGVGGWYIARLTREPPTLQAPAPA
jgi:hypothetical protein